MKPKILTDAIRTAVLSVAAMLLSIWVMAQDNGGGGGSTGGTVSITKSTTTNTQSWYTAPWVWIVGAAVFILLLIALVRGGSSRSTTTRITKTSD